MKFVTSLGAVSAIAMSLVATAPVFAAPAATKIQVTLDGEAGQPMKVVLDSATAKAGAFEFDVKNAAIGTDHEVVLVKLTSKDQKIAVNAKKHKIDESKLESMGEVAGLKPGDTGVLKVKLAAGDYLLLCNHKEHYELGMATPFTVTK